MSLISILSLTLPLPDLCSSCLLSFKTLSHSGEVLVPPNLHGPLKWLQHRVDGSYGSISNMALRLRHLCAAFCIDYFSTFMSTMYADLCHLQRIFRACGRLLLASRFLTRLLSYARCGRHRGSGIKREGRNRGGLFLLWW